MIFQLYKKKNTHNIALFGLFMIIFHIMSFLGVSCRVSDTKEHTFTTERGIFSYSHNISAANKRQKSQIHGIQSDIISPWSTKYPSMVRPRLSCGAHVLGKDCVYMIINILFIYFRPFWFEYLSSILEVYSCSYTLHKFYLLHCMYHLPNIVDFLFLFCKAFFV